MRRRGRPQPFDRALERSARKIDARDPRAGGHERLGAGEADTALCPRHQSDAAVEPPRLGSGVGHDSAMIASTSTGMSNGRCGTPTDVRAASRSSPYRSRIRSEKPLITRACSVKPSTAFT